MVQEKKVFFLFHSMLSWVCWVVLQGRLVGEGQGFDQMWMRVETVVEIPDVRLKGFETGLFSLLFSSF